MIICPECGKVMEYRGADGTDGTGRGNIYIYFCTPCKLRGVIKTIFEFQLDEDGSSVTKTPSAHICRFENGYCYCGKVNMPLNEW